LSHLFGLLLSPFSSLFFFFYATAPPQLYTLSLHDALPILRIPGASTPPNLAVSTDSTVILRFSEPMDPLTVKPFDSFTITRVPRSEEHTSELQSRSDLVCRLLLEKKKKKKKKKTTNKKNNK